MGATELLPIQKSFVRKIYENQIRFQKVVGSKKDIYS